MISKKYRCIFVHIPKVAGQSIEQFFLDLHGLTWERRDSLLLKHNPDPNLGPEKLAHLTASEYIDCGHISPEDYATYYKFAFVRNPWARIVSEYTFRHKHEKISFKNFVLQRFPEPDMYTDLYRHVIPQYDYLYNSQGQLLVNFVGKYESLQDDFSAVCSKLGISDSILPHRNASSDKAFILKQIIAKVMPSLPKKKIPYVDYYDDELREHVGKLYSKDIETFDYRFE